MPRVHLEIHRKDHEFSLQANQHIVAIRLTAAFLLRGGGAPTPRYQAFVDTGAPVTVLPRYVWTGIDYAVLGRTSIGGFIKREECRVPATLAQIDLTLSDARTSIGPLRIHAFLAESDHMPALLGMSGLLEKLRVVSDVSADEAYLEAK